MPNRTDTDENNKIGRMLQASRESGRITQQEMADAVGLSKNHISKVERGESKASIPLLLGYCRKLNLTPNEILEFYDGEMLPELKKAISSLNEKDQKKLSDIAHIIKS